jgi:hypothetical protein
MWHLSQRTLRVISYFCNMNILFSYLYRDAGNYKQHNDEIFTNHHNYSIEHIRERILNCLIDREYISVEKWGLKDLHFKEWDSELDLPFHEFDGVVTTLDAPTQLDIDDFLKKIENIP